MTDQKNGGIKIRDAEMSIVIKDFLFEGMTLPVNLFVRLSDDNYLLIGKKGEKAQFSTLKSFRNDDFQIFVKTNEKILLTSFINNLMDKTIDNPQITLAKKQQFVKGLVDEAWEDLERSNFASLTGLKAASGLIVKLSKQCDPFSKALEVLTTQRDTDARHSMLVCMVSLVIAEQAEILNNLTQEKLALGALLHDVGLKFVPDYVMKKPRHEWTSEDLELYQQHPIKGAEMLRSMDGMSVEVLMIVSEHHENSVGTGYPKRIRDVRINPLAKVVGLADHFCELIAPKDQNPYTADEAISYIENVLGQPYNKVMFSALKSVVNIQYMNEKMKKKSG